ncbi:hypothetical protein AB3464_01825 [Pseudomonas asplenii]|uniref:hypothetical protein n=1 Tax=Pseudomonas asplenii TaxID=53407 RepID=UPI0037C51A82
MRLPKIRSAWLAILPAFILIFGISEKSATILGPFLPYFFTPKTADGVNSALLGNWYEEFEYPDRDWIVHFKGTIEYFFNRAYRVTGVLEISSTVSGTPISIKYDYDGNGEWQATEKELVIKLLNAKAPLSTVTLGPRNFKASELNLAANSPALDIGPTTVLAQLQKYDIHSISKDKAILKTTELYGDTFTVFMIRSPKMYLR